MVRRVAVVAVVVALMGGVLGRPAAAYEPPPIPPDAVVFLGDSLTRQQPWEHAFPRLRTSNQGVGGNRSADVLRRLHSVIAARPQAVFLLVGSNDVRWDVPHERTVARIDRILARLRAGTPGTALHLVSVLPRWPRHTARIDALNLALAELAADHAATWVDVHGPFRDERGALRRDLTTDGSHLNGRGKALLARLLRPTVRATAARTATLVRCSRPGTCPSRSAGD